MQNGEPFIFAPQPLLATDKARFPGEPVVLVVAETQAQALDAAELVEIEYEALPAVTTAAAALAAGAPLLSAEVPGNCCFDWHAGHTEEADRAFATARHVVRLALDNHRITTNPMEPRGCIGAYDNGRYTLQVSSQNIHINRNHVARCLGVEPKDVRFIAPDVGGGFGAKNFAYAEHALILWAARRTGRPVKWVASRSEVFLSDHPARDMQAEAALALDADGRFLALKVSSLANVGSYLAGVGGGVPTYQYMHLQGTVYRLPAIALHIRIALTNTTPIGVTRGPGFAETVNILERLIDAAARQCGFDRMDLRRRNLVPADAMPMTNSFGFQVDSGAFDVNFDKALVHADVAGFAARRARERNARPAARPRACLSHQGHRRLARGECRYPLRKRRQRVADHRHAAYRPGPRDDLPADPEPPAGLAQREDPAAPGRHRPDRHRRRPRQLARHLHGRHGDLARLRRDHRQGHGARRRRAGGGRGRHPLRSRSKGAASSSRAPIAPSDCSRSQHWAARRTSRSTPIISGSASISPSPTARTSPKSRSTATPAGCGWCATRGSTTTACWSIRWSLPARRMARWRRAWDRRCSNTRITTPASGQLIAGSFMDYALPRADDLPSFDLGFNATRCTTNPLGVKGCGEAGAIAAFPAIANAILDALAPLGVTNFDGPATPACIWQAIESAAQDGR